MLGLSTSTGSFGNCHHVLAAVGVDEDGKDTCSACAAVPLRTRRDDRPARGSRRSAGSAPTDVGCSSSGAKAYRLRSAIATGVRRRQRGHWSAVAPQGCGMSSATSSPERAARPGTAPPMRAAWKLEAEEGMPSLTSTPRGSNALPSGPMQFSQRDAFEKAHRWRSSP